MSYYRTGGCRRVHVGSGFGTAGNNRAIASRGMHLVTAHSYMLSSPRPLPLLTRHRHPLRAGRCLRSHPHPARTSHGVCTTQSHLPHTHTHTPGTATPSELDAAFGPTLRTVAPGQSFGELALLHRDSRRTASVIALGSGAQGAQGAQGPEEQVRQQRGLGSGAGRRSAAWRGTWSWREEGNSWACMWVFARERTGALSRAERLLGHCSASPDTCAQQGCGPGGACCSPNRPKTHIPPRPTE